MQDNQATQSGQQKEDKNKVKKLFEKNLGMLATVLNGGELFKVPKADSGTLTEAIAKLAEEEKKKLIEDVIAEARKMIQEKRDFDKFVALQKKEMDTKVLAKQKDFNEKSKSLFAKIKDVQSLEKSYYNTLKNAADTKINDEPASEEDEENPS